MNDDKLFICLKEIFKKNQNGGLVPKKQQKIFEDWVITSYASAPIARVTFECEGQEPIVIRCPPFLQQTDLYRLRNGKNKEDTLPTLDSRSLNKLPIKQMADPLRQMGTPFAVLPKRLDEFQMKRISENEFFFSYASRYIIRQAWGKKLCQLPRVDNRIKPVLDAWSEMWYCIFKLCVNSRDFLTEPEQKKILRSWDWLDVIAQEYRMGLMLELLSDSVKELTSKEAQVKQIRGQANQIQSCIDNQVHNLQLPIDVEIYPNFYRLLEVSIRVCQEADKFRQEFMEPYISSLRKWADAFERNQWVVSVAHGQKGTQRELRGKKQK